MLSQGAAPRGGGLEVAIIGGGIAGVTLALGLLARGIAPTVYERSGSFREIGAGIGFTPNSERAMLILDPRIHAAFRQVTVRNGTDWFMWMDGCREGENELIHKMYLGERGFEGCARADFLDELVKLMPRETVHFGRNLDVIVEREDGEGVELRFTDGSAASADIGMSPFLFNPMLPPPGEKKKRKNIKHKTQETKTNWKQLEKQTKHCLLFLPKR